MAHIPKSDIEGRKPQADPQGSDEGQQQQKRQPDNVDRGYKLVEKHHAYQDSKG